jgi:hypothetical protein
MMSLLAFLEFSEASFVINGFQSPAKRFDDLTQGGCFLRGHLAFEHRSRDQAQGINAVRRRHQCWQLHIRQWRAYAFGQYAIHDQLGGAQITV